MKKVFNIISKVVILAGFAVLLSLMVTTETRAQDTTYTIYYYYQKADGTYPDGGDLLVTRDCEVAR